MEPTAKEDEEQEEHDDERHDIVRDPDRAPEHPRDDRHEDDDGESDEQQFEYGHPQTLACTVSRRKQAKALSVVFGAVVLAMATPGMVVLWLRLPDASKDEVLEAMEGFRAP